MTKRPGPEYVRRLTPMQEGMLFESLGALSGAYSGAGEETPYLSILRFRVARRLDAKWLRARWDFLVTRHSALRTAFRRDRDGVYWQAALPGRPAAFRCVDLCGQTPSERENAVLERAAGIAAEGMNPEKDVLCRLDAFLLGDEECDLLFAFHHAVLDGWSVGILLRELLADALPDEPAPSFGDYAKWFGGQNREEGLSWWRRSLSGAQAATQTFPGEIASANGFVRKDAAFSLDDGGGFSRTAKALEISRGRLLQAVWAALVSRYNGPDTFFGLVTAGRSGGFPGLPELVGMCVNTIPVKADLERDRPFAHWLGEWNRQLAEAERYAFCGLYDLKKMTAPGVDLFPHLVAVDPAFTDNDVTLLDSFGRPASDLIAGFTLGDEIRGEFTFNALRYSPDSMRDIVGHFKALAAAIGRNPEARLADVAIPTPGEQIELLSGFGADVQSSALGQTVVSMWRKAVLDHPDQPALKAGNIFLSYRELEQRVDAVASGLVSRGVANGSLVAISMIRSERPFIAALAVMVAGGAFVPFDPEWPEERLKTVRDDVDPVLVVDDAVYDSLIENAAEPVPLSPPKPDDAAYVVMTSGSTGAPKGVVVEHGALANYCLWSGCRYDWKPGDRAAGHAAFTFDASMAMLWPPLMHGAEAHILMGDVRNDPALTREYILQNGITHIDLPTSLAEEFMARFRGERTPRTLRFMSTGGEALRRYETVGYEVENEYGPTECAITCVSHTVTETSGVIPIGKPLPGMRAYVVDAEGGLCPVGMTGELCVSGPQLARGYLRRPELTRELFVANPFYAHGTDDPVHARMYRTGDAVRWTRRNGEGAILEFAGRLDSQVKLRGHRIELGEIETALAGHPDISGAVAVVHENAGGQQDLCCYVVRRGNGASADSLTRFLAARLPVYSLPRHFVFLESLPLNANGKVDRSRLPAPVIESGDAFRSPAGHEETALAETAADLLGLPAVDIDAGFSALGGDSIRAIRLSSRLEGKGWRLSVRNIMTAPSLAVLATFMTRVGKVEPAAAGPARPETGGTAEIVRPTQTQLMLLAQGALDGNTQYAVATRWRTGALDQNAFVRRLQIVVERHGMLSASFFRDGDGDVWLKIPAERKRAFSFCDLTDSTSAERGETQSALAKRAESGIDPFADPLFAVDVLRLSPNEHEIIIRHHHAILDGWSLGIVMDELFALEPPSGASPFFASYAAWMHDADATREDAVWWEKELADSQTAGDLPGKSFTKNTHVAPRDVAVADAAFVIHCQDALRSHGVSGAAFFLSVWGLLLERYGELETDPVFGVVVSGRPPSRDMENLVGMCAETIPFRLPSVRDDANRAFASFATAVQDRLHRAAEHPRVPAEMVRTLSRHLFAFDNTPGTTGTSAMPDQIEVSGQDGYDLVLAFGGGQGGRFRFNASAYSREWIENAARHFAVLADAAANSPECLLRDLPLASESERRKIMEEFVPGANLPPGRDVVQRFRDIASENPDRPALTHENVTLTYRQLDTMSDSLASRLAEAGVRQGDAVAVALPRSIESGLAILAVWKARGVYLPVDPAWPTARIDGIIADSGAGVVLADGTFETWAPTIRINPFDAGTRSSRAAVSDGPDVRDAAYLLYTSGTTGQPKGAVLDHAALANLVAWTESGLGFSPDDAILHYVAFTFDPSVWLFASAWAVGARLHMASDNARLEPAAIVRLINDSRLTVAPLPARIADGFLAQDAVMPSLRMLCVGGETLGAVPARSFDIVNLYGPTETCVNATFGKLSPDVPTGVIGRPIANMRAYVASPENELAPIGCPGELWLSGPQLARGYRNRPRETARAFCPNPFYHAGVDSDAYSRVYKTGDIARWRPDGSLEYLGRKDGQVKVRGQRVEIGEIENAMVRFGGVREARVVPARDRAAGTRLHGYFIPSGAAAAPATPESLRQRLAAHLPEHMVPSTFTAVDAWPLTTNSKLDITRLPAPVQTRSADAGDAPETPAEQAMAALWEELLGINGIGRNDDFFALGGHSLLIFSMLGRMPEQYRAEARLIFEYPVLRDFAAHLRKGPGKGPDRSADSPASEIVEPPAAYREATEAAGAMDIGEREQFEAILLTGATGFLGAHLLYEYFNNTESRFILPVRGRDPAGRLSRVLRFYFAEDWVEKTVASGRVEIVNADLAVSGAPENLPLTGERSLILHAAADTGHYGAYEASYASNTEATAGLVRLAVRTGAALAHVSTTGAVNKTIITELDADPGPSHSNVYLRTKQLAEIEVFAAMKTGLPATIFRTGNIAANSRTFRPPMNFRTNALARLTRLAAKTGMYADSIPPVGYAFVDQTANAIRLLAEHPVFWGMTHHLDNPHAVPFGKVFEMADGEAPRVLSTGELRDALEMLAASSDVETANTAQEYLGRIRQHASEVEAGDRGGATVFTDLTVAKLKKTGFRWQELTPAMAAAIVRTAMEID